MYPHNNMRRKRIVLVPRVTTGDTSRLLVRSFVLDGDLNRNTISKTQTKMLNPAASSSFSYSTFDTFNNNQASTSTSISDILNQINSLDITPLNISPDQIESLDGDDLKEFMHIYLQEHKEVIRSEKKRKAIDPIGPTLKRLRNGSETNGERKRIVLDESMNLISGDVHSTGNWQKIPSMAHVPSNRPAPFVLQPQTTNDITGAVARPTNPKDIRKMIRSKMVRCKRCKNRFLEKYLYELHLKEKHPADWVTYLVKMEDEMQQQRKEELEANRLEEITSGGFIPPANEVEADKFDIDLTDIPLPGEYTNGVAPRFDRFGNLYQPKRVYKKKVSPQCPFCDKRYRNEHSLKKHIVKKHPECKNCVQCLRCFKVLESKEKLYNHMCEMFYLCYECTPVRNLCTESRLLNHRAKFHRGPNSGFKCNLCNQKFLTPRKLRKHKKMSHVFTKTYPCHFCDELFTSETSVTTHERIHTGIIKFECKVCDFKCNRFINMEDHKKEEHGYICSICQAKLAEWSDIKNHTLNEHGGYLTTEKHSGYIDSPRVWVMFKGE